MVAIDVLTDPVVVVKMLLASVAVSAACVLLFPPIFQAIPLVRDVIWAFYRRYGTAIRYLVIGLFVLQLASP